MLDMHAILWKKLAVNCVVNPLTAIHNVTNGIIIILLERHPSIVVQRDRGSRRRISR